jgi:DNA (cytosine-5)-methyltransferase 1
MKVVSLFTGAGGLDLGFARAGFSTAVACEMNKDACATYRANVRSEMFEGDVRELIGRLHSGAADAVVGGPPCQGLSIAGKMDPLDPRSTLIDSYFDAVEKVDPQVFVMENVDALLSMKKWAPRLSAIRARAGGMGYGVFCTILNAADFGVPQSRRRFFAFGGAGLTDDEVATLVNPVVEALKTVPTPAIEVFRKLGPQGTAQNPATSRAIITFSKNPVMRPTAYAGMLFNGAGRPIDPSRPSPTITASAGGNKTHLVDEEQVFGSGHSFSETYHAHLSKGGAPGAFEIPSTLRRMTLEESRAFQTFPEGFVFHGPTSARYRQIGNAVPSGLAFVVATAARAVLAASRSRRESGNGMAA